MDSFGYDNELSPQSSTAPEITSGQPFVGMEFQSMDEARNFYEDYGKNCGFWIRTRTTQKGKTRCDDVTAALFVCSREGKHKNEEVSTGEELREVGSQLGKMKTRTCSTIKVGCLAHMRVRIDRHTLNWKVIAFNDEHNHNLVTPIKRMKMRSNRHMPKTIKNLTEAFHRENLVVGKVADLFGGDHVGFSNKDCWNHLSAKRQIELEHGDAQSALTYFRKKQAENPGFFYALQCDEVGRATNFFWVDARSRMAYRFFGDVVTFDTTYRTNKYDMPFAPFIGVNHHFQTIQFGCALLQDETEETFLWLFDTWLEAMGGSPPISIITDQDLAMKGAIGDGAMKGAKGANSFRVMDSGPLVTDGDSEHGEALRLNHMTREATKLAVGAAPYNESYITYMETMNDLSERLGAVITSVLASRGPTEEASLAASNDPVPSLSTPPVVSLLLDPNISQSKGRKKDTKGKEVATSSSRIKSGIELATEKKMRKCKSCGQLARHDSRNCPLNLDRRRRFEDNEDNSEMEED